MQIKNGTSIMAISLLAIASSVSACETAEKKPAEGATEAVAIQLFNGKDLTGWRKVGGNGNYKVEDGCIVGFGENIRGNTFLRTEKTFTDFELTFEFKFDHLKGNSGLMFRAKQKPSKDGNGRVYGYQCEGDNTKRAWTAGIFDEARRGWLYPQKITKNKDLTDEQKDAKKHAEKFTDQGNKLFKWNDWNTMKIRCVGNHIQTYLNGELRADFTDTDKVNDTREGFFGLQVHGGKSFQARWKNIKLVDLSKPAVKK